MKLRKLIDKLQEIEKEHGDLPVCACSEVIDVVSVDEDKSGIYVNIL